VRSAERQGQSYAQARRRPPTLLPQKQPLIGKERPALSRAPSVGDATSVGYKRIPSVDALASAVGIPAGGNGGDVGAKVGEP